MRHPTAVHTGYAIVSGRYRERQQETVCTKVQNTRQQRTTRGRLPPKEKKVISWKLLSARKGRFSRSQRQDSQPTATVPRADGSITPRHPSQYMPVVHSVDFRHESRQARRIPLIQRILFAFLRDYAASAMYGHLQHDRHMVRIEVVVRGTISHPPCFRHTYSTHPPSAIHISTHRPFPAYVPPTALPPNAYRAEPRDS